VTELPSGTVTFLFTDLEGSTRLLKELGRDGYHEILDEHQRLLRAAFDAHGGRVVDTQGDSFFVAFRTAAEAVAAAVDAQRDLAAARWPEGVAVKVRMGLHTGEPKVGGERYVGIGVHRAARIGACGHGGQVLLSSTTRELAEEELPPGVSIRDLGERRLKDIDQPQHVYQLVVDGLPSKFAELNTLDVALRRKKRRMYAGSALIGVLAAAVAVPVFAFAQGGSSGGTITQGNAVALIDPGSNRVTEDIPVGARPGSITAGSGSVWVANQDDQSVSRIDPASGNVPRTLPVTDTPTGLAASRGDIWVVGSVGGASYVSVRRIDPQFDTVTRTTTVPDPVTTGSGVAAASGDTVWVAPDGGLLTRLDTADGRPDTTVDPNSGQSAVAIDPNATWVADAFANTVTRVDPTGLLDAIPVGNGPSAIAIGAGGVWVADLLDDAVVRIDPGTRAVTTTIPVGSRPSGIAVGDGAVWVANSGDGTVTRIDPQGREKPSTIRVGGSPQSIVFSQGRVWVTVDQQLAPPPQGGGTLRLAAPPQTLDNMDPAIAFETSSWQLLDATCAKLLNYPDKPVPAGSRLEPEVAQSLPALSADGRTYTFTIRRGFRFSPPSNAPVTAETFRASIERTLDPRMKSPAQSYAGDIVGARAYMSGKAAHISGITVSGNTLTVRLLAPAADLPARLTLPFFCAVPPGTPVDPKGVRAIPGAGPYSVATYTPGQEIVLERNPNYRGPRPHHFDRIAVAIGPSAAQIEQQVKAGSLDYTFTGLPTTAASRLAPTYGPGSPAARRGRQQYFTSTGLNLDYILLNPNRPLFHDARLRRAVNYAVDRLALTRAGGVGTNDPAGYPERPADQYLPPGMPGYSEAHVYPPAGDPQAARQLAGSTRRTAILYTCNTAPCQRRTQILTTDLAAIGIDVVSRTVSFGALAEGGILIKKGAQWDMALAAGWNADYPDPSDFLNILVADGAAGSAPSFADPTYNRKARADAVLSGPQRYLAYGKLDVETSRDYAPWIPVGNAIGQDFFSERIGCQVYQPAYGMDLAALCLRR
jgi:YVTN family beta-propeller protein